MELLKSNKDLNEAKSALEEEVATLREDTKHAKDRLRNLKGELMITKSSSADM